MGPWPATTADGHAAAHPQLKLEHARSCGPQLLSSPGAAPTRGRGADWMANAAAMGLSAPSASAGTLQPANPAQQQPQQHQSVAQPWPSAPPPPAAAPTAAAAAPTGGAAARAPGSVGTGGGVAHRFSPVRHLVSPACRLRARHADPSLSVPLPCFSLRAHARHGRCSA
eukprot:365946-Chlamydomonas_euryale.AAC.15